jgi:pyruvate/2-oxoglutarate dehydrogenase complex dihydrolipoamide dehydrogenase (E3) component
MNHQKLMNDLIDGIRFFEKNKVIFISVKALIHSKNKINVNNQSFHPKNLLLSAENSFVSSFPPNKKVMNSKEILNMTKIPKSHVVIGNEIIGLELISHDSVVHSFEKIVVDIDPDASILL